MTPEEFKDWLKIMRISQKKASVALGVHVNTVNGWVLGKTAINQTVALACRALYHRLEPWGHKDGAANTTETSSR